MLESYRKEQALQALEARFDQDPAQTAEAVAEFLVETPDNPRALFLLARCQKQAQQNEQATCTLQNVLAKDPSHFGARILLAELCGADGDLARAIELLREVTASNPEIADAWALLGACLKKDGQEEASKAALEQRGLVQGFNEKLAIAGQAFARGDLQQADVHCRQLLRLVPNEIRTLRLLCRVARQLNHIEFSTQTLARCVAARPADVPLGLEYAYSLAAGKKFQEALTQCEQLIERAPENINILDLKAEILYQLGRYDEALDIFRELATIEAKRPLRLLHLGKVLKTVGSADEATQRYRESIAADPKLGQAYWELANLKTYHFSDEEKVSMQRLLEDDGLGPMDRMMIEFALGKALEDAGEYATSFAHYESANAAYLKLRPYEYSSQNERLASFFTADFFAARASQGNETNAPVFVVGLPRSGSTLVEQILSSHSLVDATQELDEIVSIARDLGISGESGQGGYPESLAAVTPEKVGELAQRYLDYVQPYRQQAPHFVDKAPHNFHHIGLIKTLFPNAKIVDIRRNPMASGWSLYSHFFGDSFRFSYDLETIGRYAKDYVELMDHWHAVLPGQVLTVRYEDLVNDFEPTVKAILDYCGLPFEEGCLKFYENKRAVATPSSEQVRQPIYAKALDHWKHYESFLQPLQQALED